MEWNDEGIVLAARPHGEKGAIVSLLTAAHGRYAGLVAGGQGPKSGALLQPGNCVAARWRARLLDHLGHYSLESETSIPARWMDEPEVLALIASACAMTELCLPERQPMGGVYAALSALLNIPEAALWGPSYIKWEIGLLRALGYGLDLSQCALTGAVEGLTHVSPRTGRAVCAAAAKPYKEKLLPLPAFLTGGGAWERQDIADGLALTGHFFERCVWGHNHGRDAGSTPFPPARERLVDFYRDKT